MPTLFPPHVTASHVPKAQRTRIVSRAFLGAIGCSVWLLGLMFWAVVLHHATAGLHGTAWQRVTLPVDPTWEAIGWGGLTVAALLAAWKQPSETFLTLLLSITTLILGGLTYLGFGMQLAYPIWQPMGPVMLVAGFMGTVRLLWCDAQLRQLRVLWLMMQQGMATAFNVDPSTLGPDGLPLPPPEPVRQDLTVMFVDLRNFTTMAEHLPAPEMIDLLNEFYSLVNETVSANGGFVNKYLGDGVLVLFGVNAHGHVTTADHPEQAVRSSLLLLGRLNEMAKRWEQERFLKIAAGISLHTGRALVGCFGTANTREINVVGDTVNLCSRLQDINKQMKTHFILTEDTVSRLIPSDPLRLCLVGLGEVTVRGRDSKVRVYSLPHSMAPKSRTVPVSNNALSQKTTAAPMIYQPGRAAAPTPPPATGQQRF
jgi:class 3 adenylate cyclase